MSTQPQSSLELNISAKFKYLHPAATPQQQASRDAFQQMADNLTPRLHQAVHLLLIEMIDMQMEKNK